MKLTWSENISRLQIHDLADMCRNLDEISRTDFDRKFADAADELRRDAVKHGIVYTIKPGKRITSIRITTFGKAWGRGDI